LTYKQTRILREQEETILDQQGELALAYDQIDNLKAENSSSIKCNCLSTHWTEVLAKLQCRSKGLSSSEDPNFNVKLSNIFDVLTVSEPEGVARLKIKEDAKPTVNNKNNKKCRKVLLLGSSHCRGLRECLHSVLGDEYMVTNVFKPNAILGNVVGEHKTLSKDLIKNDHVIIVGGPGLDRDLNCKIENDMDNIAKNSIRTNVGFVGLLHHHNSPHVSKWVRNANMRLEPALWSADRSHIGLTDVSS
jgi:hypothetical protein